jgi:hypothetical protein
MAASEEKNLENAIIAAVSALPYITANSIPVRNWDDQATARALPCVTVQVSNRERIAPNADFYRLPVDIGCYRQRGDDPNQAVIDQVYNEISDWANAIDADVDFSADGITYEVGPEETDDKIHLRGISFVIYDTITP